MADRQTSPQNAVMEIEEINAAIDWQAQHAEENGAPCTARIVQSLKAVMESGTATGRRIAGWQGLSLKDAMPLRIAGGLHSLVLTGTDTRLADVYAGRMTDQTSINGLVVELVETYDARLMPWLDGPPQTNEAGRSASIMAGLLWLSGKLGARFDLFELGASAGVNTMIDRYFYQLGETEVGPAASPMQISPEWRGVSPPTNSVKIKSIRGCDLQPIDLTDPESALKLKSYVWPEATQRMGRIEAAIALAGEQKPNVIAMDAAEFVRQELAKPQAEGMTRAMFHSIMWQYMPAESQQAIVTAMEEAGAKATADRPLAWLALETDPATFRHELKVRYWRGDSSDGETHLLSFAHPHGAWVEWIGSG